ncbi:MAG: LPS export ABC transporter periplasmic protein LptC [Gemmatimonadaceae bacterium]|nr:LPS export ABC transporter periplasmic protein LptC [Gemmatimonadaceae bacterium]
MTLVWQSRVRWLMTLSVAVVTLSAAACPQKPKSKVARTAKALLPDSAEQMGFGVRTYLTDKGINKGELLGDTALWYDDGTRLELRRVNLTFFTSMGEKDGVMTSRTASYTSRLSRIEARGDVVVLRNDGKRLTTQQLVYDQVRNQFFTDSSFVLNEPNRQLSGIGFESDPQLTNFRCLRACKGVAPVKVPAQ